MHLPFCSAWYVSASGERTKCLVENVDVSVRVCSSLKARTAPVLRPPTATATAAAYEQAQLPRRLHTRHRRAPRRCSRPRMASGWRAQPWCGRRRAAGCSRWRRARRCPMCRQTPSPRLAPMLPLPTRCCADGCHVLTRPWCLHSCSLQLRTARSWRHRALQAGRLQRILHLHSNRCLAPWCTDTTFARAGSGRRCSEGGQAQARPEALQAAGAGRA